MDELKEEGRSCHCQEEERKREKPLIQTWIIFHRILMMHSKLQIFIDKWAEGKKVICYLV